MKWKKLFENKVLVPRLFVGLTIADKLSSVLVHFRRGSHALDVVSV